MDSFEVNKIVGAVLTALLAMMVISQIGNALLPSGDHGEHSEPVYVVASAETGEPGDAAAEDEAAPSLLALLPAADAAAGEGVARKCVACHSFEEGGPNKVGPNLWNLVGKDIASVDGFAYSDALGGLEGDWSYEALDHFLADPRGYAPGTKMSFAGVKKIEDRANLIAWLREQSANPVPLPEAPAETAAAETTATDAAPAEEAAAETAPAGEAATEDTATMEQPAASDEQPADDAAPDAGDTADGAESDQTEADAAQDDAKQDEAGQDEAGEATEMAAATTGPLALLGGADADSGAKVARKCVACHTFEDGGANRIGPNLWNLVGRDVAAVEDFKYSDAMREFGGAWTYERLADYLAKPRDVVPGTKMAFAGVKDEQDLADLIAYMRQQSDSPAPLPQ